MNKTKYLKFKKVLAVRKGYEEKVMKLIPTLENRSGIYIMTRTDEDGVRFCYVGQAKKLIDRLAGHFAGHTQHIDLSLKKHGVYNSYTPHGWDIIIYYCDENCLDLNETHYIKQYLDKGYQMYNKNLGGDKSSGNSLRERKTSKGYYEGLEKGYANCLEEIKVYFEKYLEPVISGKTNKIKERKLQEFKEMIGYERNDPNL